MDKIIGVLGGGQLGRMLTEAANRLNISIVTLDSENCPAKQVNAHAAHINGSFTDPQAIHCLAARCDILTIETEHVNTDVLEHVANSVNIPRAKVEVQPSWRTIRTIQDKYKQKVFLKGNEISVADSQTIADATAGNIQEVAEDLGYPIMLKSRTEAYDGKGNYPVKSAADIPEALEKLKDRPLYAEQWANFVSELAVMVIKIDEDSTDSWEKATMAYPVVETIHENSICKLVYAPARNVSTLLMQKAQSLARRAVARFEGRGVFGVELFLLDDGNLLINEIAPRPHNSGHYTIEACPISQYEAHIRAILRLPIPEEGIRLTNSATFAIMLNLLGGAQAFTHVRTAQEALSIPGASIHLYGKGDARPGRKMGHVTILASSMSEAEARVKLLTELVDEKTENRLHVLPQKPFISNDSLPSRKSQLVNSTNPQTPLVAITMGSDSDRFVLSAGIGLLKDLNIPHSVTITSAHRTPQRMFTFAREAASKGIKVIIAAAGGAAHLPGMIAAITSLPVIGIPIKGSALEGNDSLLSIVQMPRGCPVATVAINNSINAVQLAMRILAVNDADIRKRLEKHLADQTASVIEKAERMERVGFEAYCSKEEI